MCVIKKEYGILGKTFQFLNNIILNDMCGYHTSILRTSSLEWSIQGLIICYFQINPAVMLAMSICVPILPSFVLIFEEAALV